MRTKHTFPILLIIASTIAVYFNSLFGDFLFDDFPIIVNNPLVLNARNIPLLFSTSY